MWDYHERTLYKGGKKIYLDNMERELFTYFKLSGRMSVIVNFYFQAVQREGSLLKCLITFKEEYSDPMNDEINACFGAIEHWQILSLKDIRLSFNFKQACR